MGFNGTSLGLNEPTLTQIAYVCYLLSFLFYSVHLFTRSAGTVRVASGGVALAGAGAGGGGTVEMAIGADGSDPQSRRVYSPLLGRLGFIFVLIAWLSLTGAL